MHMNKTWILAACALVAHAAHAADEPPTASPAPLAAAAVAAAGSAPATAPVTTQDMANGDFCLYPGTPPSDVRFRSLGHVKLGKGSYGGVRDELPSFVAEARAKGADAVINYNGAQRFGFWPWRLVRPVLTGIAVKFDGDKAPDCRSTGGSTLATVMTTNVEPARSK
jgi:hypothetical protein